MHGLKLHGRNEADMDMRWVWVKLMGDRNEQKKAPRAAECAVRLTVYVRRNANTIYVYLHRESKKQDTELTVYTLITS